MRAYVRAGGLVALLITSVAEARAEPPGARLTPERAREAVEAARSEVEAIRRLTFKKPVPVAVADDAEARAYMLGRLEKFEPRPALEAQQRAWRLLGLIPQNVGLVDMLLQVLEEQAGGYYDPGSGSFVLLDDMPPAMAPVIAAHELTHALEDQYFDLDRRVLEVAADDDLVFARSAVHEGSAMIVMALYTVRSLAAGRIEASALEGLATSEAGRAERLRAMPEALRRQIIGTYLLGMSFLLRGDITGLAGGFPADDVARAYDEGPVSSEQLLHPEKFWNEATRDDPRPVTIEGVASILGRRWSKSAEGVLGELVAGSLVGAPTPSEFAPSPATFSGASWTNEAASGWGGDRWELWTRGRRAIVVLKTVWDSARDAEEFVAAVEGRPGLTVRRADDRVAIVAGEPGRHVDELLDVILR